MHFNQHINGKQKCVSRKKTSDHNKNIFQTMHQVDSNNNAFQLTQTQQMVNKNTLINTSSGQHERISNNNNNTFIKWATKMHFNQYNKWVTKIYFTHNISNARQ